MTQFNGFLTLFVTLGALAASSALGSVPGKIQDDRDLYRSLKTTKTKKNKMPTFDRDIRSLIAREERYRRQEARKLKSARSKKYKGPAKNHPRLKNVVQRVSPSKKVSN